MTLARRYTRSVNLERDAGSVAALKGYVLTPRAAHALERCLTALDPLQPNRAFTLTGIYGTGKSAFAQLLTALSGPMSDHARRLATDILATYERSAPEAIPLALLARRRLAKDGLLRVVVTARHEPLSATIARGLADVLSHLGAHGGANVPRTILREVRALAAAITKGDAVDVGRLPELIGAAADALGQGALLVVDELGKALEYAAEHRAQADIHLLQQLAEGATSPRGRPLVFIGLLHQTFVEYGAALTSADRTEWQKVQARFEDIAFTEAPEHMLALVRSALVHDAEPNDVRKARESLGRAWHAQIRDEVRDPFLATVLTPEVAADVYPLHPVAALALPALCTKYAQHDRSLFTFLTSSEPSAFATFLREHVATAECIPTQRLAALYDYFVNVAGHALAFRPQFQRWAEVHGVISEARSLEPDLLTALKTIGALNLIAASGPLRASRGLVLAALMQRPNDSEERARWSRAIDALVARHVVTYRSQLDEFRVWEGSDFDVDVALREQLRLDARPLAALLAASVPMGPVVAQRHSFETGTLRYFERRFVDQPAALDTLRCTIDGADGLIVYWVGGDVPPAHKSLTSDGRPVVVVATATLAPLRAAAGELAALRAVALSPQLQADGVARREVRARIAMAEGELAKMVRTGFDLQHAAVWISGEREQLTEARFNARLSRLCDETYPKGVRLWNELINRRQLTSNGARARADVIRSMLAHGAVERLNIVGDGPEASLYESVLRETGIHRQDPATGQWIFAAPTPTSGIRDLWDAVDGFCVGATASPRTLDTLLALLDAPPHGVKRGVVPLVLAAVLLVHSDDVSVYYEGSFVPVLGPEHFEILLRQPQLFAVKHFQLTGLRGEVFRELEAVVRQRDASAPSESRNPTLLGIVRPLVRFATSLCRSTKNTSTLSPTALAVRDVLLTAREPDALLFENLPQACGLPALEGGHDDESAVVAVTFRKSLHAALRELDGAYERQLERCATLMHHAFALKADRTRLREDLRARAQYLVDGTLDRGLRSFLVAAVDDAASERAWLEALVMIIADRPADTWTDDDAAAFEMRLSDMARRFRNLERLVQEATDTNREGFDARRITITRPDGSELHKLVWVDHHARELIDRVLTDVRGHVAGFSAEQQWAVAAAVVEAIFAGGARPEAPMIGGDAAARPGTTSRRRNAGGPNS